MNHPRACYFDHYCRRVRWHVKLIEATPKRLTVVSFKQAAWFIYTVSSSIPCQLSYHAVIWIGLRRLLHIVDRRWHIEQRAGDNNIRPRGIRKSCSSWPLPLPLLCYSPGFGDSSPRDVHLKGVFCWWGGELRFIHFKRYRAPHNAREGFVPVNRLGATYSGTCCDSPFQSPACAHASQEYVVTQGAPEESLGPSKGFNPACEGTCPEFRRHVSQSKFCPDYIGRIFGLFSLPSQPRPLSASAPF